MLLGRQAERLALDRLLAEARGGRSGVLALVGEPGIGKSSLLDHAAGAAEGMLVLRARGIPSEADVPFAGLHELLGPALGAIDSIPPPQAQALAGAFALAPASRSDRFAVGAATLSLIAAYADEQPLALLVDDAHLLDDSSADALLFAARRLVADPVALVLVARQGEPSLLDGSDIRVVRVPGLERADAIELLRSADVNGELAERLFEATGGNPLALLELAPDAARLPVAPPDGPLPLSARITAAFAGRVRTLPEPARQLLVLAAAGDPGDTSTFARAATVLELDLGELVAAEAAGLVTLAGGGLEFRHPLARSAVYSDAAPEERRAAHAALAAALPDRDVDQRAWHLAAATIGPSDEAAAALQQAGARARDRSAYAVAAGAFEAGGHLATSAGARGRMLLEAADAASLAGSSSHALALVEEARRDAEEPALTARLDCVAGLLTMQRGPVSDGYALILEAAGELARNDPDDAVMMLAEAVRGAFYAGDTPSMVAGARQAAAIAEELESPRASFLAAMAQTMAYVADGDGKAGAAAARRGIEILRSSEELLQDLSVTGWVAVGPMWLREADAGRELMDVAAERARSAVALGALPSLLHHLGRYQAAADQWAAAETNFDEAIRLARETGQRTALAASLAGATWLEARQGREAACRAHAAETSALCEELGMGTYAIWALEALGNLELALSRPEASVIHHEAQLEALAARGISDVDLSPVPELVEAYLRCGRAAEAAPVALPFLEAAQAKRQPYVLARAARCQALMAQDADAEREFETALELHERTPDAFETARTRLLYGARLRRMRKRVRAREELRTALAVFERLGAGLWAEQARAELLATGETARRREPSTLGDLTPQEHQIARLLAAGRTTKETAAALFLSPKTVEYHLGHVYRKLGIASRDELRNALSDL